ncbi:MAG: bifunctional adenosylcobinamide kinase/adenosylcobinamide-phosphate guanylyltransferase [Chloroflexota bacterium]
MGKITFILGGARSGKSSHALRLAEESGKPVAFIATAQAFDDEMSVRIEKHKAERPAHWKTLEITREIAPHVSRVETEIVVLDCVTLLVSNLLMQFIEDDRAHEAPFMQAAQREIEELIAAIRHSSQHWIIVSNEVGLGLVPSYQMGRVYRDGLGWANQRLARAADDVLWMVAGIPVPIGIYRY